MRRAKPGASECVYKAVSMWKRNGVRDAIRCLPSDEARVLVDHVAPAVLPLATAATALTEKEAEAHELALRLCSCMASSPGALAA